MGAHPDGLTPPTYNTGDDSEAEMDYLYSHRENFAENDALADCLGEATLAELDALTEQDKERRVSEIYLKHLNKYRRGYHLHGDMFHYYYNSSSDSD